jgi:ornithine cyclodeaminase
VLEASIISAVRTAGSAVLAAECLLANGPTSAPRIGFVGCGIIARRILDMFIARGWNFRRIAAFDLVPESVQSFLQHAGGHASTAPADSYNDLIEQSDIVIFATTATKPYVIDAGPFRHRPLVLHISLRDLSPDIILNANNVVDDVDHCLRAETSPHLAEQQVGHRAFVSGTIADAVGQALVLDASRATVVSPFGIGVLDLAVGRFVYGEARRRNAVVEISNFFYERQRW